MLIKKNWSIYVAGAVPWFVLLAVLIYTEYFSDWNKGGLGAWVLAQFLGGTIAAAIGVVACIFTRNLLNKGNAL